MKQLSALIKIAPTVLLGLILSMGLIAGVIGGTQKQTTQTFARQLISSQKVYTSQDRSATFVAITSSPVLLTLHINELTNYTVPMRTTDNLSHVIRITNLPAGIYHYYFSFSKDGNTANTDPQSFQIP